MPDDEGRETYGTPTGWSDRETTKEPSPKGLAGAQEASPPPDATAPSSGEAVVEQPTAPEEEQASEQAPPPTSQPEPKPKWNLPPPERWEELRQQADEAKRQRDEAIRLAQEALQRTQPVQPAQPQADPWEPFLKHADPQTSQFYGQLRELVRYERAQAKQEAVQEVQPLIQAGMEKLARIDERDFRKENPDIKPGSPEEQQIIAYMNGQMDGMRHPLESAKRNVLYDKLKAEVASQRQKQSAIPQKRAAATTDASTGMPASAGLPGKPSTATDRASEAIERGGGWLDAAKAYFR